MSFLLPLLGNLIGPLVGGLFGQKGHGVYQCSACEAPCTGGRVHVIKGELHHHAHCLKCGKEHHIIHSREHTQRIVHELTKPSYQAKIKAIADMHGEGIWDLAKAGLGALAKHVLPKVTEAVANKVGDVVTRRFGESAGNVVKSGIGKAGDFAQALAEKHLVGSGAHEEWDHHEHTKSKSHKSSGAHHPWREFVKEHKGSGKSMKELAEEYHALK